MSSFDNIAEEMRRHRMKLPMPREVFRLQQSKEVLTDAMTSFLRMENRSFRWLPEYDEVADWLADSQGRGLFLYGNCGRGKSLLTRYVLPAIFLNCFRKVVNVYDIQEMNAQLDSLLTKCYVALDDVGTEEVIVNYGNRRMAFSEIVDAAEKQGKMLIVSSNLQQKDLLERYGDRTVDRLKAVTRRILFVGESMR